MLRFAYSTINWGPTCDLATAFREIRETGWGGVELYQHALDWLGPPAVLMEQLGGLQPATLFGSVTLPVDERQRTLQKRRIDYAAAIGATAYGIGGGQRPRQRSPTAAEYAELSAFFEELAIYAAHRGIAVSYHPHTGWTVETSEEVDRLLDGTEALRLCLDASHIALVDEDPLETFHRFWNRIGYLHLKDWARGKFVEMGRGTIGIDFPTLLRDLDERGFAGWVVIENSRSDVSPVQSAQINAEYMTGLGYTIR